MTGLASVLAKHGFANAEKQEVSAWLSTGYPVLDNRLSGLYIGGGIPQGRITEIAGPSSAGKTAISTNIMISAQKAGGVALFMDHEKSFDIGLAKSFGLNDDPDYWVYDLPMTYEESWDKVKAVLYLIRGVTIDKEGKPKFGTPMLPYDKPVVVVFDSLASMTPQEKFAMASEDQNMRSKLALASLTSQTFDVMATIAEKTNTTFVFLNQLRENPGVLHGDKFKTPGGNAPEYYCTTRLRLGKSVLYDETKKEKYGTLVRCEVVKNKAYRPFLKCEWEFHFQPDGTGKFDAIGGVIDELKKIGKIESNGAYLKWDGKSVYKSALVKKIEADPAEFARLYDLLPTGPVDLAA